MPQNGDVVETASYPAAKPLDGPRITRKGEAMRSLIFLLLLSDLWFNCHVNGNLVCGPDTPWHGFVNLPIIG